MVVSGPRDSVQVIAARPTTLLEASDSEPPAEAGDDKSAMPGSVRVVWEVMLRGDWRWNRVPMPTEDARGEYLTVVVDAETMLLSSASLSRTAPPQG